jgi:hypothetical protein
MAFLRTSARNDKLIEKKKKGQKNDYYKNTLNLLVCLSLPWVGERVIKTNLTSVTHLHR